MKEYRNGMKATEISKKQVSVIYAKAKNGELKVERWVMNRLYNLADYYGYDDNRSVEEAEAKIIAIIEAVFNGEDVQGMVDEFAEWTWGRLGRKSRENCNHELVA